jgi:uncharacterized protein
MLVQIKNPLLRSITAAFTALSIVTIGGTVAIAIAKSNNESSYKTIVYASLAAAVAGGALGLSLKNNDEKEAIATEPETKTTWKDWRNLKVVKKVKESEEITSFYLKPEDNDELPNFLPGQFLTIKLDIPAQNKPISRSYSLSDYNHEYYRLSIKREGAPKAQDLPPGIASNFMHDRIQVGSTILAKPPSGKFVLDVKSSMPAVLISNGVGITPMISMAKAATQLHPRRHIWFLHGARDGSFHAFREEVNAIADLNPNIHIIYSYSRPTESDRGNYQRHGYVDMALIQEVVMPEMQQLCGSVEAEYFLCGTPSFMDSLIAGLKELGVPDNKVLFEAFGKAMPKNVEQAPKAVKEVNTDREESKGETMEIVFSKSGKTLNWSDADGSILDFAEANGINPDYSCRAGVCGTCMCKIAEGEVAYDEEPSADIDPGSVLICISRPKTARVILDI